MKGGNHLGFAIAEYDVSGALIVDPVLSYSTYLGGSKDEVGNSIAVDSAGNAYVTGQTASIDFHQRDGALEHVSLLKPQTRGPETVVR